MEISGGLQRCQKERPSERPVRRACCSPPPSATEPINAVGIYWPITSPHVPVQQQPDLVHLEKNRKLGSARNQNTPFLSPGPRGRWGALEAGHRTGCGVGALQAKPVWRGASTDRLGSGQALLSSPGANRTWGGREPGEGALGPLLPCGDRIMGHWGHM